MRHAAPVDHSPGETQRLVQSLKWPDSPHLSYPAFVLGEDRFGTWCRIESGTKWSKAGDHGGTFQRVMYELIPHDGWWKARWMPSEHTERVDDALVYVDISTPCEWVEGQVQLVDLDLDVVRREDGIVEVLDETEFQSNSAELGYPTDVVRQAVATAEEIRTALEDRRPPFDDSILRWSG